MRGEVFRDSAGGWPPEISGPREFGPGVLGNGRCVGRVRDGEMDEDFF